jgi:hypothetical protein
MPKLFTKSRFKVALDCATKLYYGNRPNVYANQSLEDPFLAALAEGGFQVGELAKFMFCDNPVTENITVETLSYEESLAETEKRIKQKGKVVIAEAAFRYNNLFVRTDIFVRNEDKTYEINEVKAKSWDKTTRFMSKKGISSAWKAYLYDVAFQRYVFCKSEGIDIFSSKVKSNLILVDKDKKTTVEGINQVFKVIKVGERNKKVILKEGVSASDLGESVLIKINVDDICFHIFKEPIETDIPEKPEISFEEFIAYCENNFTNNIKIETPIGKKCKGCEFKTDGSDNKKSGFHECWKKQTHLSDALLKEPLVFDLWAGGMGSRSISQEMIDSKIYLLKTIPPDLIMPKSGSAKEPIGMTAFERRALQINKVKNKDFSPFFDAKGLSEEWSSWTYPLHLIDFETSMVAIPFHKNRKPYEAIAFQFSHHIMHQDGKVEHVGEFLSADEGIFPNYDFVRALKKQLENDNGTIFRYHSHENSYLIHIYKQLLEESTNDTPDRFELMRFIESITHANKAEFGLEWTGDRDMVDLYRCVMNYYYSPYMGGSNSIKKVLPAIINDSDYLQKKYSQPIYGKEIKSLNFTKHAWIHKEFNNDPYHSLPPVFDGYNSDDLDEMVANFDELANGGAALMAYNYLQFSEVPTAQREKIKKALLKYCELDTMAMVMILEGWREMIKSN